MADSPLLEYANAYIKATSEGAVTLVDGRYTAAAGTTYLVRAFIKRAQYSGVSTGSVKQPLPSQMDGKLMPGASGDQFLYRGYALQYATVAPTFNPQTDNTGGLTWTNLATTPTWLRHGKEVIFYHGATMPMNARIERSSGVFGGAGIDSILYQELGGVEIQLYGAEIQQ